MMFLHKITLPNKKIVPLGEISIKFINLNINYLYEAISYVYRLPYGRTTGSDYRLVLQEKIGTCSTKHALIAALAKELSIPIQLRLGLFILNSKNTPRIKDILIANNLTEIPEAHCYLQYQAHQFDITFPENINARMRYKIIKKIIIHAEDIGNFKIQWHKQFIKEWLLQNKLTYTLDEIWAVRETCINALSKIDKG